MIYQEFLPDFRLQHVVACYWRVKSDPQEHINFRMIFPDGCTDVIFNFADPLLSKSSTEIRVNTFSSFVVGNMTRTILSSTQHQYDLLGIRFKPGGMRHWLTTPLAEFTDEMDNAEYYPVFQFWYEELCAYSLLEQRHACLDRLLLKSVNFCIKKSVDAAISKLRNAKGVFRIADLSRDIGVSQKQLERDFKKDVGLSPKQLARVIQFQHMTALLQSKGEESLLQLAIDGGYNDHAHFTKSFREFSGITPQEFLKTF